MTDFSVWCDVRDIGLPGYAGNALSRNKRSENYGRLRRLSDDQILAIPGVGRKALAKIREIVPEPTRKFTEFGIEDFRLMCQALNRLDYGDPIIDDFLDCATYVARETGRVPPWEQNAGLDDGG